MIKLNVVKRDPKESTAHLRSQGLVPAVCYGSQFESTPVTINDIEFRKVYRESGTSSLISLEGDLKGEQCIVQDIQAHVVSGDLLHIDFKMITAGEVTEVTVPVELVGEADIVSGTSIVHQSMEELNIEVLPKDIPHEIKVDISGLKEIGDSIKVSDLKIGSEIKVLDDENSTVVSVSALVENVEEEPAEDAATEPELVDQKGSADEGAEEKSE